jgi:hypothetical protein
MRVEQAEPNRAEHEFKHNQIKQQHHHEKCAIIIFTKENMNTGFILWKIRNI